MIALIGEKVKNESEGLISLDPLRHKNQKENKKFHEVFQGFKNGNM